VVHALDVHWRIAAPLVFRDLLPAPRLRDRAVPIPPLGAAGRGPALEDALIIACVHVVAHHRRDPLLLWLYEIAALARALDGEATGRFVDTARKGRVVTACAAALHRARRYFDGDALRALARTLDAAAGAPEPSAAILRAAGPLDELWIDLKACDGWRERAALVREHAYPDSEYMQAAAGHGRWAYARRLVRGLARWTALSAAPGRTAARDEWPAGSAAASPRPRSARTTR
jgi:hypothetical protein